MFSFVERETGFLSTSKAGLFILGAKTTGTKRVCVCVCEIWRTGCEIPTTLGKTLCDAQRETQGSAGRDEGNDCKPSVLALPLKLEQSKRDLFLCTWTASETEVSREGRVPSSWGAQWQQSNGWWSFLGWWAWGSNTGVCLLFYTTEKCHAGLLRPQDKHRRTNQAYGLEGAWSWHRKLQRLIQRLIYSIQNPQYPLK